MGSRWWGRVERAGRGYALASTRTVAVTAGGLGLVLAGTCIAVAGPWQGGDRTAERRLQQAGADARRSAAARASAEAEARARPKVMADPPPTWRPAQDVLLPASGTVDAAAPLPSSTALASALAGDIGAPSLGTVTASVVDVATGRSLYSLRAGTAQPPASTNKLATATAALALLGPDHRFTTRVVSAAPGRIVLVGGGDPTLTASASGGSDPRASLVTLADRTAAALKAAGTGSVSLGYDISLFTGSPIDPRGNNDNLAPVQALTSDEGRIDPTSTEDAPRYADPAATAAGQFATLLRARGITVVQGVSLTTAPAAATPIAQVSSQPLAEIVERMLTDSDNDVAETLGHQVAVAAHEPATFAGGAAAVRSTLTGLGVRLGATRLDDASGLDPEDAIPADVLTRLLALAASPAHPELRAIPAGLPVAGFTGTLDPGSEGFDSTSGLGVVRAKTGSLTSVNTLAGLVVDRDGRLLAFAFMSDGGGSAVSARAALDSLAGRVAACGCR